ncbi:protein Red-like isoform X2 [Pomacea canaliculata]|nr:protein Red-like isoform X2 [Pomacea canaliculata]
MSEREMNMFSNPLLPIGLEDDHMKDVHPLKNEDFQKMLMTPLGASNVLTATISQAKRRAEFKVDKEEDAATMRKKKKSYYAKLQRDKEERQKELASKHKDRARERCGGLNRDEPEQMSTRDDYRAVAPDAKSEEEDPEEKIEFKTKLGYNIYRTLFKNKIPPHNEPFLPKRMACAVDLEDGNFDIPSTIICSKADSPSLENTAKLTTQDLVINKVIQIFSDLRLGKRELQEKGKQKEDDKPKEKPVGADERAAAKAKEERLKKLKAKTEIDSFTECYPGMMESADAIDDSDEEAGYTRKDRGSKKGPVGRWGFDTQEEYSSYMSRREDLPKAALQ